MTTSIRKIAYLTKNNCKNIENIQRRDIYDS